MPSEYNLLSIDITKEVNRIPTAQIILLDGNAAEKSFEISNTSFFQPGTKIEIQLRYEEETDLTLFIGIVVKHSIQSDSRRSLLSLYLKDAAFKLTTQRKNAVFRESDDAAIIKDIINAVIKKDKQGGVTDLTVGKIAPTQPSHKEIIQFYCTDWDFILSRAEANGLWVVVNEGEIAVQRPDPKTKATAFITYGINEIYDMEMEADIQNQYKFVETSAWDVKNQDLSPPQKIDQYALDQSNLDPAALAKTIGADQCQLVSGGELDPKELQAWAEAKLSKSRWSMLRGRIRVPGAANIKLGDGLELDGIGDRFNGKTLITGIRHQVSEKGWQTDIQFGVSAAGFSHYKDIADAPAAGLVPAVNGLQIGIVEQYVEDPDKKLRVKVKIPRLTLTAEAQPSDKTDGLVWARLAVLDAGLTVDKKQGRGTFFRPEPGDEVILGFLNDDPRQAVILGSIYSEKNAPPKKITKENSEKGIVTKENLKLIFNDKDKSIRLETPGTNRIILIDQDGAIYIVDENNNQFTMNADGIQISSDQDIAITAKGNITLQGKKVDVK